MKTATEWLAEYGESHQHKINKLIHWLCVPVIFWSVALMLWSLPVPELMAEHAWLNWASVSLVLVMVFYVIMSLSLSAGMLLFSLLVLWLTQWVSVHVSWPTWQVGLAIFIVAWIFQFIGHHLEGKKPSFFKDILFLLVGPAWLMGFIYRRLGIPFK